MGFRGYCKVMDRYTTKSTSAFFIKEASDSVCISTFNLIKQNSIATVMIMFNYCLLFSCLST